MSARRLAIVDTGLRGFDGHCFDYDREVASAARAVGLEILVVSALGPTSTAKFRLAGGDCVDDGLSFAPFGEESGLAEATPRLGSRMIGAVSRFAPDFAPFLRRIKGPSFSAPNPAANAVMAGRFMALLAKHGIGPDDHVFIPTPDAALFAGLLMHLRQTAPAGGSPGGPVWHFVLRRDLDETGPLAREIRHTIHLLADLSSQEAEGWRLRLYADTARLCRQYRARFPLLDFSELPIPVRDMNAYPHRDSDGYINIVMLGSARREKGFHHLGEVIEPLRRARDRGIRARLVVQTNPNLIGGDPGIAATTNLLRRAPSELVTCIDGPLTPELYAGFLTAASIVLLPYDPALYLGRSSGIFAEALALGKPVIVPDSGWMAADHGVTFAYPDGLGGAVAQALAAYDDLRAGAQSRSARWSQRHNAARLVSTLLRP